MNQQIVILTTFAMLVSACMVIEPPPTQFSTPTSSAPQATSIPSPASSPTLGAMVVRTPTATRLATRPVQTVTPENGPISLRLSEVPITITFPSGYVLSKSLEANRRGSFVSYDFKPPNNYQTPYLKEIQFFSAESIREFAKGCLGKSPCFFGDLPDLGRYFGQLKAYAELQNFQNFELRRIGDRYFFVSSHACQGDVCVIREYTTFVSGNVKVDLWILMEDESQIIESDELFLLFHLQE